MFQEGQEGAEKGESGLIVYPNELPGKKEDVLAPKFSGQELNVLRLTAKGLKNAQIGNEMGVSPRTVDIYASGVYRKLKVRSRVQAVFRAIEIGIITPQEALEGRNLEVMRRLTPAELDVLEKLVQVRGEMDKNREI